MPQPAPSLKSLCVCQVNYIGDTCQTLVGSLTAAQRLTYGCQLSPCLSGSTCEDKADGSYVCHCASVSIYKNITIIIATLIKQLIFL